MRLAYLILAHKNPDQVRRLAARLNNDQTEIFIHVDKKTANKQMFYSIMNNFKNVHFVKREISVHWGAFSMIEATLSGMAEIIESGSSCDYITLMSGMDYPIKIIRKFSAFSQGIKAMNSFTTDCLRHPTCLWAVPTGTSFIIATTILRPAKQNMKMK